MNKSKPIRLTRFKEVIEEVAIETRKDFPELIFDYGGMHPVNDNDFRYDPSPINADVFANTGGDGVHYSILELSETIQPIVMTIPMAFSTSMKEYNWVIAESLNEFLSLGYYNGWYQLEDLLYRNQQVIEFYSDEKREDGDEMYSHHIFYEKLRTRLGYKHFPLNNQRLKELEGQYFDKLEFKADFMKEYIKD